MSALRWELYASFQNLLDTMAIIVSDLGLRRPGSYADLGAVLYNAGLISEGGLESVKLITVTRNILAHAYRRLGPGDLGKIVKDILPKVEAVAVSLERIAAEKNVDPEPALPLDVRRLAEVFERNNITLAYIFGSRARGD